LGVKLSEAARAGKSLVPVWREYREMTQTALAEASGVNRVYLSEIESSKKPAPWKR
jgi:transcriptional regulator with XRE-family HTH domain